MKVTAEGVETTTQLTRVISEGCSDIQGYLLSRPIPVSAIATYMADHQSAQAGVLSAHFQARIIGAA